jgi:hypothetical protein
MPQLASHLFAPLQESQIDVWHFFREAEKLPSYELEELMLLVHSNPSPLEVTASSIENQSPLRLRQKWEDV